MTEILLAVLFILGLEFFLLGLAAHPRTQKWFSIIPVIFSTAFMEVFPIMAQLRVVIAELFFRDCAPTAQYKRIEVNSRVIFFMKVVNFIFVI